MKTKIKISRLLKTIKNQILFWKILPRIIIKNGGAEVLFNLHKDGNLIDIEEYYTKTYLSIRAIKTTKKGQLKLSKAGSFFIILNYCKNRKTRLSNMYLSERENIFFTKSEDHFHTKINTFFNVIGKIRYIFPKRSRQKLKDELQNLLNDLKSLKEDYQNQGRSMFIIRIVQTINILSFLFFFILTVIKNLLFFERLFKHLIGA